MNYSLEKLEKYVHTLKLIAKLTSKDNHSGFQIPTAGSSVGILLPATAGASCSA